MPILPDLSVSGRASAMALNAHALLGVNVLTRVREAREELTRFYTP
jgi:hypothetical protein